MQLKKYLTESLKALLFFILFFVLSSSAYFYIQSQYIQKNRKNYVTAINNEVQLLIELKKTTTFDIAKRIALDKNLINIMRKKEYEKFYDDATFKIAKKFKAFKNIALHIVDRDGVNRYLSWTKKALGKNVLPIRKDLQELYLKPHSVSNISVGKFDITFKGTVPIYDESHTFLGVIEVITHFNSISEYLAKDHIYTALVIDKRFTKQLVHPFSDRFIDGYNISTLDLHKDVEHFLKLQGIPALIKNETFEYFQTSFLKTGYFGTKVDILGVDNQVIAHYLIFIQDKEGLYFKVLLLRGITILLGILFIIASFLGFEAIRKNRKLIVSLHERVKEETAKNLNLIYNDNLTECYKKEKFLADKELYKDKELVMLNIKNFNQVNATYGFSIGDEVLKITASKVHSILEQKIYRIDSDEFVFVSDAVEQDIENIKQHFRDSSLHISHDDINLRVSFSFSVVHGGDSDVLRKLTIALKQAKREPYKPYVYYHSVVVNDDFIRFNSYLYDAIFSQQGARIVPYFQGIRDNKSKKIMKYESLARLEVNGEIYAPYYFIEIAKNSGFLFEITKIMIDKTFAFLAMQVEEITISINITEDDLLSKHLKEYLLSKLAFYHIDAQHIVLEILDGVSSGGTHSSIIQLKELKELGFKLAIDDFGVEYSNFERINELEVDFIKIDGKYIKNIDTNPKSYKIAKAIAEFASSMDIKVIAEFVENEAIQKIVKEIGIDFSQGYHFSIPSKTI